MSSIFEVPPSRPSGSPFKVVTAFSAGAVIAGAIGTLPGILYGTPQPAVPPRQPAAAEAPRSVTKPLDAAKSTLSEPPRTLAEVGENAAQSTGAQEAAAQTAQAPAIAIRPGEDAACEQRAWPYADHKCGEPDTNSGQAARPVRVIPADRNAPPTIGTAAAPSPAAAASAERKTTGEATTAVPIPPPAPDRAVARAADEPTPAPPDAAPKAAKAEAKGKKDAKRAKPSDQQRRAMKSRAPNERDGARERDETSDYAFVRSHVLPDGRRVTVYRTLNRRDDARAVVGGETSTRRAPLPPRGEEDDEED